MGLAEAIILVLYGVISTLQPTHFTSVVLSILCGGLADKVAPDCFELLGGLIELDGIFVIMYWPR